MDVNGLQQLKQVILKHPNNVVMERIAEPSECGTTLCIAGWKYYLDHKHLLDNPVGKDITDGSLHVMPHYERIANGDYVDETDYAKSALRLPSDHLFYHSAWPKNLREQWEVAEDGKAKAAVMANAIDAYIADHATFGW